MGQRHRNVRSPLFPLFALLTVACGSRNPGGMQGSGGALGEPGTGGVGSAGDGASGGNSAPDGGGAVADASAVVCPESLAPRLTSGAILEIPLRLFLADQPMTFGEPNVLPGGGTLTPLNVRFYVSNVALLRDSAAAVPVDMVTAAGAPEPYGVHLFNAEDPGSTILRIRAPAGPYTGFSFLWGLDVPCNVSVAAARNPPLSFSSQMSWPVLGYLFFRYEGRLTDLPASDVGNDARVSSLIAMGGAPGLPTAPAILVPGSLSVPASGLVSQVVRVQMDEVFRGSNIPEHEAWPTPVPPPPGGGLADGERLRQSAAGLKVFVFAP